MKWDLYLGYSCMFEVMGTWNIVLGMWIWKYVKSNDMYLGSPVIDLQGSWNNKEDNVAKNIS